MIAVINKFAEECVERGYITQDQVPFFVYRLECKYTCGVVGIPFFMLGAAISSPLVALFFYIGFYILRTRTSGIHAKRVSQCMVASLVCEVFFLGLLFRVLSIGLQVGLLMLSILVVFLLAPYRDPNIDFTDVEYVACSKSSKRRMTVLIIVVIILHVCGQHSLAKGMSLGIIMAATLLLFAYLKFKNKGEYI